VCRSHNLKENTDRKEKRRKEKDKKGAEFPVQTLTSKALISTPKSTPSSLFARELRFPITHRKREEKKTGKNDGKERERGKCVKGLKTQKKYENVSTVNNYKKLVLVNYELCNSSKA
jgi:hypothetical protein